jgi:hypothetical protein
MRLDNSNGLVAPYKTHAWADVEKRFNVTIIANVGDQESGLSHHHRVRQQGDEQYVLLRCAEYDHRSLEVHS